MTRILVTCPPMLGCIDSFRARFDALGWRITAPAIAQTMDEAALIHIIPDHDGWITGDDPTNRAVLGAGVEGRLRAVVKWGVGVDNVDFEAARALGIPIANTPNMFGQEVADLALSYLIALAREAYLIDRGVREGAWPKPAGISLAGKTVGLVGLGDIGRHLAVRLLACGLKVIAYDPGLAEKPEGLAVSLEQWPDRIGEADFIVFACALTPANRHMLDTSTLAAAKPGVRIVNVARGGLVDERALAAALLSGHVHSAALDVFEIEPLPLHSDLRGFERCILGSHNASNTVDAVMRASDRAIEILAGFLAR